MTNAGGSVDTMMAITLGSLCLLLSLFMLISLWVVYTKAGEPGWAVLIPIYNVYVLLRIAGMSPWWLLAMLIPLVSFIPAILIPIKVAERFGRGMLFGIGLLLLPFVFYPVLAFTEA